MNSETEETASSLAKRIYNQSAEEKSNRDTNSDLNHAVANVEDDRVEIGGRSDSNL